MSATAWGNEGESRGRAASWTSSFGHHAQGQLAGNSGHQPFAGSRGSNAFGSHQHGFVSGGSVSAQHGDVPMHAHQGMHGLAAEHTADAGLEQRGGASDSSAPPRAGRSWSGLFGRGMMGRSSATGAGAANVDETGQGVARPRPQAYGASSFETGQTPGGTATSDAASAFGSMGVGRQETGSDTHSRAQDDGGSEAASLLAQGGASERRRDRIMAAASRLRPGATFERMRLRRKPPGALDGDAGPGYAEDASSFIRKPISAHVEEEKSLLQPLMLSATGCLHFVAMRLLSVLTLILGDTWVEAFLYEADDDTWRVQDDGVYRASSNVHCLEPWNRERLRFQVQRAYEVREPSGAGSHSVAFASVATDEWRAGMEALDEEDVGEILACNLSTPRLASFGDAADYTHGLQDRLPALRIRSHVKSKRRQLQASQLYELRIDIAQVTLSRAPSIDRNPHAGWHILDTPFDECRTAAELRELYMQYRQDCEADAVNSLTTRLEALVEQGRSLRQALDDEDKADPETRAKGVARKAFAQHLDERSKTRARRDERERQHDLLCRSLYGKWRELRKIREDQAFTSTPWCLKAQQETHDLAVDTRRRASSIDDEIEEVVGLHGIHPQRARENIEHRWTLTKRAAGTPTYKFEVGVSGTLVTPTALLESRVREALHGDEDHHLIDARWPQWRDEVERRKLVSKARMQIECRIGSRVVGSSPSLQLHWETWSTASVVALEAIGVGGSAVAAHSVGHRGPMPPIHSFDLAVHTMPRGVMLVAKLKIQAGRCRCRPFRQDWALAPEVEVEIPSYEGKRVTHAAVLEQNLKFGSLPSMPSSDAVAPGTHAFGEELSEFSGDVAVCVSWPGASRQGGLVVPPPSFSGKPDRGNRDNPCAHWFLKCFHFISSGGSGSPRAHKSAGAGLERRHRRSSKADERLTGLRFDPQNPEAHALIEASPAPKALPGYDVSRLREESCPVGKTSTSELSRFKRVQRLLHRSEREGLDTERILVPGFDQEVAIEKAEEAVSTEFALGPKRLELEGTEEQRSFLRRMRARAKTAETTKTHISYRSIVHEHGQEAEESDWMETVQRLLGLFQPLRTLRPQSGPVGSGLKIEGSATKARVHVSLARVSNLPVRTEMGLLGPTAQSLYGRNVGLPSSPGMPATHVPTELLPAVVVEMQLTDLDGRPERRRSTQVPASMDPDIHQTFELTLKPGSKGELNQETLASYEGQLTLTIFDEVVITDPELGGVVRSRRQRRYLGQFALPWSTIYANKCAPIKGYFRVERPYLALGYRPTLPPNVAVLNMPWLRATKGPPVNSATGYEMSGGSTWSRTAHEAMYISLSVTIDPMLAPPERVVPKIARGCEPNLVLKRVEKWLSGLKTRKDLHVTALGTDVDGRSRLVCRFVRPQQPPSHIEPQNPFAIEEAARYVSLIPFLDDNSAWPGLTDVWCTDQEFIDFGFGDWEEHAILLCNYFNYIDRYRQERVDGYRLTDIQSYVVMCDILPQGEIALVLRRDCSTGHCELWQAVNGDCYFVPCCGESKSNVCQRLFGLVAKAGDDQTDASLRRTPHLPVQRVHMAFNAENVWANLQRGVKIDRMNFDVDDSSAWTPLFVKGRDDDLLRIDMSGHMPSSPPIIDPRTDFRLADPSHAIVYKATDERYAAKIENDLEAQLDDEIREHRAMGRHGGIQQTTRFNRVVGSQLGDLLNDLELLSRCQRRCGDEAIFPLRSPADPPISKDIVEQKLLKIESDFKAGAAGHKGRTVYGVPLNQPYTDFDHLWHAVRDTRILELGDEQAEYAIKVRVYPYDHRVLSVWVFVACAMPN